jgi:putative pyruvate formate lyase activating enzyme
MSSRLPPPEAYRRAARRLARWQRSCVLCPRGCRVDRHQGERGFCRAAATTAAVNTAQLHHGEEPPISGRQGSGTVFFAGCTLACRFCQNYQISQEGWGEELAPGDLAAVFLQLQLSGAHNLNLVTPTPHLPVILEALGIARENGCRLPVVYNTSGYERAAAIRRLEGLVEVYLPDYKYGDEAAAARLSDAEGYVRHCRQAIAEMHRQVGPLQMDDQGVAVRGVLVRHLVLPGNLSATDKVLPDLMELGGPEVWVSLMSQYYPAYRARGDSELGRRLTADEHRAARRALEAAGIENGFVQGLASADGEHFPGFNL